MSENKIVEFLDKESLEDEAAHWLIRMDGDADLTSQELLELNQWRARSPAHKAKLDELAALWNKANILTELAVPVENVQPPRLSTSKRFSRSVFGSIAASLFVAIAVMSIPSSYFRSMDDSNGVYSTKVGQRQTNKLSDGSQVQLNTDTKIRVNFNEQFRDVYLLKGEAHFEIAKNKNSPFRVFAGNGRIRAVGTAFSVHLKKGNDVDIVVSEGRVALAQIADDTSAQVLGGAASHTALSLDAKKLGQLKAGEAVTIAGDELDESINIEYVDVSKRISWTKGVLVFSGETLDEVVSELSRYTNVSIEFAEPELRSIRIGGRFPTGESEIMFAAIESNVGLQVRRVDNNRVVISDSANSNKL